MSPVALISGGQRGIGLGVARALAGEGFAVALVAEVPEDAPEVAAALAELGERARYMRHDLRDVAAAGALVERVEAELGPITTLVSNAGVPARVRGDMLDVTPENFAFVMDVNAAGAFFLAQAVARRMVSQPPEHYRALVFVTSVSAEMVSVERAEYCVSKAAASVVAQLFAARLAAEGIGVFELRPGIIETDMTRAVKDAYTPRIEGGLVPARRWGVPDDIAAAVVPLVTGAMGFSQGAVIPIDGGLSIPRL